jgi:hypothetical protein
VTYRISWRDDGRNTATRAAVIPSTLTVEQVCEGGYPWCTERRVIPDYGSIGDAFTVPVTGLSADVRGSDL